LIEVKSKSYDEEDASKAFINSRNEVRAPWLPYVHDVAFQTLVVRLAHPEWEVTPHLLLVNKTARAPFDCINSLFVCRRDERGNPVVSTPHGVPDSVLKSELLKKHDVSEPVEKLLKADYDGETFGCVNLLQKKIYAASSIFRMGYPSTEIRALFFRPITRTAKENRSNKSWKKRINA
jgi:hypothetical protein